MADYYNKVNLQNRVRNSDSSRENTIVNKDDTILYSPYQYRTLIINSRERDRSAYDDAFNFQIKLDEPVRFVHSIKLIDFICHLERRYLIHSYNNTFESSANSDMSSATTHTLPIGDYGLTLNNTETTETISTGLTALITNLTFTVDAPTDKTLVTNTTGATIYLRFPTTSSNKDSLAYILGFKEDTIYTIANSATLTSPYRTNYTKSSVAVLSINENDFDVINANLTNKTNQTYGIINIDKDYNKYKAGTPIVKYFYNPLNYLDKLKIEVKDIYGNYFDFHDSDLIMTFLIEYENQRN
jgi:hypothetical protein